MKAENDYLSCFNISCGSTLGVNKWLSSNEEANSRNDVIANSLTVFM